MYSVLVYLISLALVCQCKPLEDDDISVEGLSLNPPGELNTSDNTTGTGKVIAKASVIPTDEVDQFVQNNLDNPDTKKHYYLFKIKEFYDFLPYRRDDGYLRLEIIDQDETSHGVDSDNDESHGRVNRDTKTAITDSTLKQAINILQSGFLKKRDVMDENINTKNEFQTFLVRSDLGNFYTDPYQKVTADPDDPENNNARYVAYVPFFRVRKYYINRKHLGEDF